MRREEYEDGMIMVEAIYVVVIAIMIIFFGFNVAVVYHNKIVLTAVADEAATSVANIYGVPGKEPFYAYMDEVDYKKWDPYRYLRFGKWTFDDVVKDKCRWYASYLVWKNEFRAEKDMDFSGVTVTCGLDFVSGVTQVEVNITRKYPAFTMNPVVFWGLDPEYTIETTGTAVCYDVIHQMNTIAFRSEMLEKLEGLTPLTSKVKGIIESAFDFWDTVTDSDGEDAGNGAW